MDICFIEGPSVFRHAAEEAMEVLRDEADEQELEAIHWLAREIRERALTEAGQPSIVVVSQDNAVRMSCDMPGIGERPALFEPSDRLQMEIDMVGEWIAGAGHQNPSFHRRLQAMTFDIALEQAVAWEMTAATHAR